MKLTTKDLRDDEKPQRVAIKGHCVKPNTFYPVLPCAPCV
jgi:hypothetical protein